MIKLGAILGLLGLFVATGVIAWSGIDEVLAALSVAGEGILYASFFHLVPMWACIMGWQALLPGRSKPSKLFMLYVLWIRASVNNLMPVARIGGEIISVRVMIKHGVRKSSAVASTVVEITLSMLAQFVFVLMGVLLFIAQFSNESVTRQLLWGVLVSAPLLGLMAYVQKVGIFGLFDRMFKRLFRDKWKNFVGGGALLDRAVKSTYRRQGRSLYCFVMQFLSWALCSVEIWIALYYLGHPLSLLECMMIEALLQAAVSASFVVPGALGVQEAGFMLFGSMLGLTPEIAAALAVIRRCRDLILYVPGLVAWQVQEGRWLVQRKR